MPSIVTTASVVQCPHQGVATLTTGNSSLTVDGNPALLESDVPTIAGCPFMIGPVNSPCVTIQWIEVATMLTVGGVGVVLESSVGLCLNPAGAPQGPAVINGADPEVDAI